ncbi:hypothetical protein LMG27952_05020 [Paraburkholderia hiiakae]|uniref:HTH marR-type domain-containing protein n=1 Tax=Paraburkholderia hiiakae TaxID=1081782 RepID=A0ABN7I6G1_9BURK|nr:MarR family transcriptional regulator [Paraburkholderia hiiakae]CAD6550503.1 hypothetical protein LMG27952_05020 [Paraburkholderia hiiakae]
MNTLPLYVDDCFAIRQAARHISKLYERHLSEVDMTPTQFSILSTLARAPGLTMLEMAEAMVMDRTTLIRTLKPLERNGLVGESSELGNKRRLRLNITAAGRAKLDEAIGHWRTAQASFETSFGEREAARLRLELFRLTSDNSQR